MNYVSGKFSSGKSLMCSFILCVISLILFQWEIRAETVEILTASDGKSFDGFGMGVGVSGDYAVIGSPFANGYGQAYIFQKVSGAYIQTQILTPPQTSTDNEYGYAVAIDGDYIAVADAEYNDGEGSVYIYNRDGDTWSLQATLVPPSVGQVIPNSFGYSLALSGDLLIVGAPYSHTSSKEVGLVYIYKYNGTSWELLNAVNNPESDDKDRLFGYSVDIVANYGVIGAIYGGEVESGSAFIVYSDGDTWTRTTQLDFPDNRFDIGQGVSIDGTWAAVSCYRENGDFPIGYVETFSYDGANWNRTQEISSPEFGGDFGWNLVVEGTKMLISDPGMDTLFSGSSYLYELNAGTWELEKKYSSPGGGISIGFGVYSAMDGDSVLVGSPMEKKYKGAAYLWELNKSVLIMQVDPASSGVTDPAVGSHTVTTGDATTITATPITGYIFSGWTVSGDGVIADETSSTTTVTVDGTATVTATFSEDATLTVSASPEAGGSTVPSGSRSVKIGSNVTISANAASGYYFDHWAVSGPGIIADPFNDETTIYINGSCSVVAKFKESATTVQLTMAVSPSDSGTVIPSAGTHTVVASQLYSIAATPATGYHFVYWTMNGPGTITDAFASSTRAVITGNATITAVFEANTQPVTLTMAVSPAEGGSTNPSSGDHTVNANQTNQIEATPASGYHFVNWTIQGAGTINGPELTVAWVTLSGNATVTANFAENSKSAILTVSSTPDGGGTTSPGSGAHTFNVGQTVEIIAHPASGYYFKNWTVHGNGEVEDLTLEDTWITLDGDASLVANFESEETALTLTMAVSPTDSGSTNPGVGTHTVYMYEGTKLTAQPAENYCFSHWSISGKGVIDCVYDPDTIVLLAEDATVTANFIVISEAVTLTLGVSPENSGYTNPGAGEYQVQIGKKLHISTVPADGYFFKGWLVSGDAILDNPYQLSTHLTLSGQAKVSANFATETSDVQLIMNVSPVGVGTTNPGVGTHTVSAGAIQDIQAVPATGYYFAGWTYSGNVDFVNPVASSTDMIVYENSMVTANFVPITTTAEMTLSVSPVDSGTTNPGAGTYTVNVGEENYIQAVPSSGYHFVSWTIASGNVELVDSYASETYINVVSDCEVTANFASNETAVTLSMVVSPVDTGWTNPGVGSHTGFYAGSTVEIFAEPISGYHFVNWSATGANIEVATAANTTAVLVDESVITANFAVDTEEVSLTLNMSPDSMGTIYPEPGTYTYYTGQTVKLEATTFSGYYFVKWEIDGDAVIQDDKSKIAYATLRGDVAITALFSSGEPIFLTHGSIIDIDLSAQGLEKSPKKVYAVYYNTLLRKSSPQRSNFRKVSIDDEDISRFQWQHHIKLYQQQDYPQKDGLSELLLANPIQDLRLYGVYLDLGNRETQELNQIAYAVAPIVEKVTGDYSESGDVFIVEGKYFGDTPPKVWVEYVVNEKNKYKSCKIDKKESRIYLNAKGDKIDSCMKILDTDTVDQNPVGWSRVVVSYPKIKRGETTGYIILVNHSGMVPYRLPEQ